MSLPKNWIGKTIKEVGIRQKYGINIMAIKENGNINLSISPDDKFEEGKSLLVLGEERAVQKCFYNAK